MARILDNLETLKSIVHRKPFGLITDMDGTISEIPQDFLQKTFHPSVPPQLCQLVSQVELLSVVSGRKTENLQEIVNIEGIQYIGNYGMEWWDNNHAVIHPAVAASMASIRGIAKELETLRSLDGIIIQDKWATLSVHYHMCPQPEAAKQQILDLLGNSTHIKNLRLLQEKTNIGIVPRIDIDKGTAVTGLIKDYQLKGAIYLGDDIGDVPAFRAIIKSRKNKQFDGLAILVLGRDTPRTIIQEVDFTLNGVQETEILFQWLVDTLIQRKV